jgi:uncharacterized protein (UPF0335 family)
MTASVDIVAHARLRSLIERVERLNSERKTLADDIKEVFAEAKGTGFDTKIMRQIIKERARDQAEVEEERELLDVYRRALGMLADLPLGIEAVRREGLKAMDNLARMGREDEAAAAKPKRKGKNGHAGEAAP